MEKTALQSEIKRYIQENISKSAGVELNPDTPLISGGIIDSISTLKMVDFLENTFKIEIQPHEVDRDNLDTIELISNFVLGKL